jgi:hypothetical protein
VAVGFEKQGWVVGSFPGGEGMGVDPGKVEKGIGFRSGEPMAGKAEGMGIPINMYIYTLP